MIFNVNRYLLNTRAQVINLDNGYSHIFFHGQWLLIVMKLDNEIITKTYI